MKAGSTGLIQETLNTWQPYYRPALTDEDARGIATNMTNFFKLLRQWESPTATCPSTEEGNHGYEA